MKTPTCLIALLLLLTVAARAEDSLANARRAQALLAPDAWSRILRIENRARGGPYPRIVHALIFELEGLLWFYTDVDGTQSLSLHRNNLAAEKANLAPLLRDIEPGFARWTVLPGLPRVADQSEPLRNGCFIESVAAARMRQRSGRIERPRLLTYYCDTPAGRRGHTVLTYAAGETTVIFDPAEPTETLAVPNAGADDPLELARAVRGGDVAKARFLPLAGSAGLPALAAVSPSAARQTGS